jgi:Family of unknown function (DUF6159)
MGKIRAGWELTKKSWALLRTHRVLFTFPVYGVVASLVIVAVTVLPGIYLLDANVTVPGGIAVIAIGIYVAAFVGYYFSVGLAAAADKTFRGESATVADGLAVSRQRLGAIAGWALISALLGVAFAALEQIRGVGLIIGGLLNAAWSLITFLAVPVIALEGTGPIETVKRSAELFRSRWVGQVTGNVAIGGIVALVGLLPGIAITAIGILVWSSDSGGDGVAFGAVLVAAGVVIVAVSMLLMQAMRGVFGVALYRFAADGRAAGGFTEAELESAVRSRGGTAQATI